MSLVTLSFDNGPDAEVTPRVLDVLARRGIKSSFFAIGKQLGDVGAQKALARAQDEGHWVGNHSWNHEVPIGEDERPGTVEREIVATEKLLADLGCPTRLFRPFGGGGKLGPHLLSTAARDYLAEHKYTCVTWNCVPRDWVDQDGWVPTALAMCAKEPEALVVIHDYVAGSMKHLDRFCGELLDAGHTLRQAFPESCLPMREGVPQAGLDAITTLGDITQV
jgi:peptidoglycan/xylan/chitin deacetylase (PgdA/CDA1 family)